jgi:hypothetical protein
LSGHKAHGFQAFVEFGVKLTDFEGDAKIIKEEDNFLYSDPILNFPILC